MNEEEGEVGSSGSSMLRGDPLSLLMLSQGLAESEPALKSGLDSNGSLDRGREGSVPSLPPLRSMSLDFNDSISPP